MPRDLATAVHRAARPARRGAAWPATGPRSTAGSRPSRRRGFVAAAGRLLRQPAPAAASSVLDYDARPGQPGARGRRLLGRRRRLTLQLAGFDAAAGRRPSTGSASPARPVAALPADLGHRRGVGAGQRRDAPAVGAAADPGPRRAPGCSAIFDAASVAAAGPLVRSVERGIADVAARVPYEWTRRWCVYALSDPTFLERARQPARGDPDALDAVAFPVPAGPGDARGRRHPGRAQPPDARPPRARPRDRLVRHELTHVAVGRPRRPRAGVAQRGPGRVGLGAGPGARGPQGLARRAAPRPSAASPTMPDDATSTTTTPRSTTRIAWWACEYLAADLRRQRAVAGARRSFTAPGLDDARRGRGAGADLGRHARTGAAAKLMIATYDPGVRPATRPTATPRRDARARPQRRPARRPRGLSPARTRLTGELRAVWCTSSTTSPSSTGLGSADHGGRPRRVPRRRQRRRAGRRGT